MSRRLPDGFTVRLGEATWVHDGGRTLVGGAPTRALFLTAAAAGAIASGVIEVGDARTAALAERLLDAGIADPVVEALHQADLEQVTFVVPTRDRPAQLERLLASIARGGARGDRIIVVDDASLDPRAVARVATRYGANLVALDHNVGPADARNAGLARVTSAYVAFVDSDTVLLPDTIGTLLRHFADPAVAVVAPRIRALAADLPNWVERYEDARSSLDLGARPALVRPRSPVAWVSSTCLVARVDAIGPGFSEGMRVGEDVDLVWRLADEGWAVRYEPAAEVLHEHRDRVLSWARRKAFYGTGAEALAERHPRAIAPAVLAPWSVAFVAALLAQRRWSVPVAAAILAVTAARLSRRLPRADHSVRLAARLTLSGAFAAATQTMALILRHWWPIAALTAMVSRRARRAVAVAAVIDAAVELVRLRPKLDPFRFAMLRRLDDLAYGAGVWFGAVRARSLRALLPDFRGRR
jgi:mycofactocin system glycosyltransferase